MPAKQPLRAEDLYDLQFVEDPQLSPDGKRLAFVKLQLDRIENRYVRHIWLADLDSPAPRLQQFTRGTRSDTSPRWSPDGRTLAFVSVRDGASQPQIHLIAAAGGEARALTRQKNGATHPVWSPDGRRIAFLSPLNADERRREDAGDEDPPAADALEARHRREREEARDRERLDPRVITRLPYRTDTEYFDDRYTQLYLVDALAEPPAPPARLTDADVNFDEMAWTSDGAALLSVHSRVADYSPWEQQDVVLVPARGKRRLLRRLTRPGHDYNSPEASPDGQWTAALRRVEEGSFAVTTWLAVRPAKNGVPLAGEDWRDLTVDLDRPVDGYHWSADSRHLYFLAGDHGDVAVYRVGVQGGKVEKVVGGRRMVLGFSVGPEGQVAFTASTPERPGDLYLANAQGKREQRLTDFNRKLLAERVVAPTEEIRYRAADGHELQGWLLRPPGGERGRRLPLVVSVHGGPHVMWGPSVPSMWLEWQMQAARGYAVFYSNPRGSEGYGHAHADAIRFDWGEPAMGDVLAGVDHLVAAGVADPKRLALTGGSYAGYLTAWIVGRDHRFACAWAQRGLYNLISWYGTADIPQLMEREFGMYPFDDVQKSWQHSPLAFVREIQTPLAIEHQDQDYRCPVSDAEQLFTALHRLRKPVVFYRYPREGHEMSRSGEPQHRVDRLNRMADWFDRYCRPPRAARRK